MKKEEKLVILNSQYFGTFRLLTTKEVIKYTKILNTNENEYLTPYAMREATNDIISSSDSVNDYSDFLFSRI